MNGYHNRYVDTKHEDRWRPTRKSYASWINWHKLYPSCVEYSHWKLTLSIFDCRTSSNHFNYTQFELYIEINRRNFLYYSMHPDGTCNPSDWRCQNYHFPEYLIARIQFDFQWSRDPPWSRISHVSLRWSYCSLLNCFVLSVGTKIFHNSQHHVHILPNQSKDRLEAQISNTRKKLGSQNAFSFRDVHLTSQFEIQPKLLHILFLTNFEPIQKKKNSWAVHVINTKEEI